VAGCNRSTDAGVARRTDDAVADRCDAGTELRQAGPDNRTAPEGNQGLIYIDTGKDVGDPDHLKAFASEDAAEKWFAENDPEGVAFEYEVLE
jgi:hypothetical protein